MHHLKNTIVALLIGTLLLEQGSYGAPKRERPEESQEEKEQSERRDEVARLYKALRIASSRGELLEVKSIVSSLESLSAPIDRNEDGMISALMAAAREIHLPVVNFLVSKGSDINWSSSHDGKSVINILAEGLGVKGPDKHDELPILHFLISKGGDVNHADRNGITPLMAAVEGYGKDAHFFIQRGALVDAVDRKGETALMKAAARATKFQAVRDLVENGAKVNRVDSRGESAIFKTAKEKGEKHSGTLNYLLEQGADPSIVAKNGKTAAQVAKTPKMIEILQKAQMQASSSSHTLDPQGWTPLMDAAAKGSIDEVKGFLQDPSSINSRTRQGYNALMIAVQRNYPEIVQLLLNEHANLNTMTGNGLNALALAGRTGGIAVMNYLLNDKRQKPTREVIDAANHEASQAERLSMVRKLQTHLRERLCAGLPLEFPTVLIDEILDYLDV